MRGIFATASAKTNIEVIGESWQQGDQININWGIEGDLKQEANQSIALALIDLRKIKKNDPKAFTIIESVAIHSNSEAKSKAFALEENVAISDGTWTLSIVVGDMNDVFKLNRLDLPIKPWGIYSEIIQLIENFKRFKMKSLKNKKTKLDAKFAVPAGKEYGAIDALNIYFERVSEENQKWPAINMQFLFKIKKLSYSGAAVETVKENLKVEKLLQKGDYLSFGDSINQEKLLQIFEEVFSEVTNKSTI